MRALKIVLAILGVCVLSCIGLGVVATAVGPPTEVTAGTKLQPRHARKLEKLGLLEAGETVRLYYSTGFIDVAEGLAMLTDRRLVLYDQEASPPEVKVPFSELASMRVSYSDSWVDNTTVWIALKDGSRHSFELSSESGGDREFVSALEEATGTVADVGGPP